MDQDKLNQVKELVRQARRECTDAETADSHIMELFRVKALSRRDIPDARAKLIAAGATSDTCDAIVAMNIKKERELSLVSLFMKTEANPKSKTKKLKAS